MRRWYSHWCIGRISPCPNQSRWLQTDDLVMKNPYHYGRNIHIHCADKKWLRPLFSACWTSTVILLSAYSWSHLCTSVEPMLETTDSSEVMFTSLFSGKWKFETLLVRRAKSSFLLWLSWRNAFQESWCHLLLYFSDLTSPLSCWIVDTVRLLHIPNNVHSFTNWR